MTPLHAIIIALLACIGGGLWRQAATPFRMAAQTADATADSEASAAVHHADVSADFSALFSSLSHSLRRHALVMAPLHVPDDLTLHREAMANLTRDLPRIAHVRAATAMAGSETGLMSSATMEAQFQSLPLLTLTSMALQRDHMMKELLREGWAAPIGEQEEELNKAESAAPAKIAPEQRPDFLTPWDVEQFGRRFLLTPLELMLSQPAFDLLRPQRLPHQKEQRGSMEGARSVLTYAVERGLYAATTAIISQIKRSGACTPALAAALAVQSIHLRATSIATDQGDERMQRLLATEASDVPCIVSPAEVAARSATPASSSRRTSAPIAPFLRGPEAEAVRAPAKGGPDDDLDAGGWRQMPAAVALAGLESLPTRDCPLPRVPLADLGSYFENQAASHAPATPIFITDALVGRWAGVRNFTRGSLLRHWGSPHFEIGRIPYADLFAAAADRVTLAKYFTYMDNLAHEQIKGIGRTKEDDPNLSPWYVFDGQLFRDEAMLAAGWRDSGADDGSSLFRVPSVLRAHISAGYAEVVESPQFFLGPAGSGAPMHYHCPAVNGLAFGRKRWFLYPPGEASYTKLHPRLFLQRMARGVYGSSIRPPFACTQQAGEVMFVPAGWAHATINEHESIGVAVEFDVGAC